MPAGLAHEERALEDGGVAVGETRGSAGPGRGGGREVDAPDDARRRGHEPGDVRDVTKLRRKGVVGDVEPERVCRGAWLDHDLDGRFGSVAKVVLGDGAEYVRASGGRRRGGRRAARRGGEERLAVVEGERDDFAFHVAGRRGEPDRQPLHMRPGGDGE